ncbi:MAG: bifunctional shikimate kinase/3-dehydroquinate synthase [Solirubrobacterales bacterium]|nr:bifunctional shikimate kinase/3-dehydroquinate synthase [Solirubrobacterales bacterium]
MVGVATLAGPGALRPAIVFTGFMGAGKTTLAREVAHALDVPLQDSDALLTDHLGTEIESFFASDGEAAFREREAHVVRELLERADGGVIALGGGALTSPRVREALVRHVAVLVDVDVEVAWQRAHGKGRPLAGDRDAFVALYRAREATYLDVADVILPSGTGLGAVRRALAAIQSVPDAPPGARLLWASAASGDYPVWIGRALLGHQDLAWPVPAGRRFCISDATVAELHAGLVPQLAGLVEIPPGEAYKTLETAGRVWRALADAGATRADHVVAVGGGVVGDLAGFAAACYQRGIPVVQVPTTVVSQVDSAYGGKTGVDLPEAKNYVGVYHQPAGVIVDTSTLATLPPEEHAAGYAEVVKTALIAGGVLWDRISSGAPVDDDVILACARTKLATVAADERDGGRRQVLNLGHTIGHAIETVTAYGRYRHGEAVGLGLLAALTLSGRDDLRDEVRTLLHDAGLPTTIDPSIDRDDVLRATARDKKRVGETTPFVLVDAPGRVSHGHHLPADQVQQAIASLVGDVPESRP